MKRKLPIIVLGAGGHARVLIDIMLLNEFDIIGIVDNDTSKIGSSVLGIPVIGGDKVISCYDPDEVQLANGLGSVRSNQVRGNLFNRFKANGYRFANIVHPTAIIARDVQLQEGIQIMAGAIVQTGSYIGENSIVNTRASVDHDCKIGANVHVAPGVTLSGGVKVGNHVHIGTGAIVIQGIEIGEASIIAAGAVVINHIPPNVTIAGVPGIVVRR